MEQTSDQHPNSPNFSKCRYNKVYENEATLILGVCGVNLQVYFLPWKRSGFFRG